MCFIKASVHDISGTESPGSSPQIVKEALVEFPAGPNVEVARSVHSRGSELEVSPHHMTFQENCKPEVMMPGGWELSALVYVSIENILFMK